MLQELYATLISYNTDYSYIYYYCDRNINYPISKEELIMANPKYPAKNLYNEIELDDINNIDNYIDEYEDYNDLYNEIKEAYLDSLLSDVWD